MADEQRKFDVFPETGHALDDVRLGALGEMIAARKLEEEGYKVVEQNAHIRGGELDIIAIEGDTITFVEVKTRANAGKFRPKDNVTRAKSHQIKTLAAAYIKKNPKYKSHKIRFDVVEVIVDGETLSPAEVVLHRRFFD